MSVSDLSKWKALAVLGMIIIFSGLGAASIIDLLSGTITEAFLDSTGLSSNWVGLSGDVGRQIDDTDESIYSFVSNSETSGSVIKENLDGLNADRTVYSAVPFIQTNFEPSKLSDMSISELQSQEPFPQNYFPAFYQSPGFASSSDSPLETFDQSGSITLFEEEFDTVKSTTKNNVDVHMLKYEWSAEGVTIPAFFVDIDNYDECYNGNSCNYQFILPNLEGSKGNQEYNVFMVSKTDPVDINTIINGERKDEFETAAQPYNLTVETRAVFGGNLVEQDTRLVESEGNNLFIPSISSTEYESEAFTEFVPENGRKELLVVPTKNNAFDYSMQLRVLTESGEVAGRKNLTVASESIPTNPASPEDIELLNEFSTEYNQGVNALRPLANCVFRYASNRNEFYRLDVDSSTSDLTLTPGVPYILDVTDPNTPFYKLSEPGSRLVFMPSLTEEFGNRSHSAPENRLYRSSQKVLFTPTVNNLNDDDLKIELEDGQGKTEEVIDINAAQSTCGDPDKGDGSSTTFRSSSDLVQRVNTLRPILDAMFRAGN